MRAGRRGPSSIRRRPAMALALPRTRCPRPPRRNRAMPIRKKRVATCRASRVRPTSSSASRPATATSRSASPTLKRSRAELLLAAWLTRKLPLRDYLLGTVFCTTSRWLIFGDTGIGKTLFALSMAGAMASGRSFLGWAGKRRARVMYFDGEMPAETFKERMKLVADECGADLALYG